MDKFTRMMLEQTGLISMIGKSERGPVAIEAIKDNKSAYLMAVGGAAYLVAKAIKSAKVVGFADLGMEGQDREDSAQRLIGPDRPISPANPASAGFFV